MLGGVTLSLKELTEFSGVPAYNPYLELALSYNTTFSGLIGTWQTTARDTPKNFNPIWNRN